MHTPKKSQYLVSTTHSQIDDIGLVFVHTVASLAAVLVALHRVTCSCCFDKVLQPGIVFHSSVFLSAAPPRTVQSGDKHEDLLHRSSSPR